MVKVSYEQKPYRRSFMKTFGAQVYANPDCTGSLGIAISEAVEDAATHDDTFKSRMFASDHYRS